MCATGSTSPSAASAFGAAVGCSDRGTAAASKMRPGDVDWERIFGARAPAGSTAGASSARSRRTRRRWRSRRCGSAPRTGRSSRSTSTTVPRCGRPRRHHGAAAEVNARAGRDRRRAARERGGPLGRARLLARGRRRDPRDLDVAAYAAAARPRARRPSAARARRDHAPPGTHGDHRTTGAPSAATAERLPPGAADAAVSRSSIASAAATRSPPG